MKGPLSCIIFAACMLPPQIPVSLLITTDEETTKEGARRIARDSQLLRDRPPSGIIIAEPTSMRPVRGHRGSTDFIATATGIQAHSSTGQGRNANWDLLPFLAEMRALQVMLRDSPDWQDPAYSPSFCDLNLVIDNHGTAANVTVGRATAILKFRYSRSIDAEAISERVLEAAALSGVVVEVRAEAKPPELPADHPLVKLCEKITGAPAQTAPYGTDGTELQAIAPCVVLGPGDIATAHTPHERVRLSELSDSVDIFMQLAAQAST
jgi:acetylornithine deacetylase